MCRKAQLKSLIDNVAKVVKVVHGVIQIKCGVLKPGIWASKRRRGRNRHEGNLGFPLEIFAMDCAIILERNAIGHLIGIRWIHFVVYSRNILIRD